MNQHGDTFKHICELFPYKFEAKLKQGIPVFVGPEIRKLLKNQLFKTKLISNELGAWNAFELVVVECRGRGIPWCVECLRPSSLY